MLKPAFPKPYEQPDQQDVAVLAAERAPVFRLMLYNDDVNSAAYIVHCLREVLEMGWEAAEQCTMLAHYKGKVSVKEADNEFDLLPFKNAFSERGVDTRIE